MRQTREDVLWGCKTMCGRGHVLGTSGNISARAPGRDLFVITPTSMPYDQLRPEDLVAGDMDSAVAEGTRKPSIEFSMHLEIYRRRLDVAAVVHTHSPYATAAGAMRGVARVQLMDVEAALYLGGDIAVAPFALPGSKDLAVNVVSSLGTLAGVILENHGAVGVGRTMRDAVTAADIVERACRMFLAVSAAGAVKTLPEEHLAALARESAWKRGLAVPGADGRGQSGSGERR